MVKKLTLYIHTIRYLRWIQIYSQFSLILKKRLIKPFIIRYTKNKTISIWNKQIYLIKKPVQVDIPDYQNNIFRFLNETHRFSSSIDWNSCNLSKLWLYNLHYFDYLIPSCEDPSDARYQEMKGVLEHWIDNNPIGTGNGWEPYPSSLRIVNWIYTYSFYQEYFEGDPLFENKFIQSLYQQTIYLLFFFETHLLANHYFANIKALFWAGCFFYKSNWLSKAERLLDREMKEQILKDGGHCEQSPMYHSIVLIDVLDLVNLLKVSKNCNQKIQFEHLRDHLQKISISMLYWLQQMTYADGRIALFGDSAFSIAPDFLDIQNYALRCCGVDSIHQKNKSGVISHISLHDSGYHVFKNEDFDLFCDTGKLGVPYQPGHAHCDLASYEYSFRGERFIVDSGVGEYVNSPLRHFARSAKAHNTVHVPFIDQAELWSTFRMGRRIENITSSIQNRGQDFLLEVSYRNDLQKKQQYIHHREFHISASGFSVQDSIPGISSFESYLHFHPECYLIEERDVIVVVKNLQKIAIHYQSSDVEMRIEEQIFTPEFGKHHPVKVVVFISRNNRNVILYQVLSNKNAFYEEF